MESHPQEIPLPDTMPLMVLSGATHFPRSLMPLFIFEQRYREMLHFVLEGDRMFGVAFAVSGTDPDSSPNPVRPVFTAGLVRACVKHHDGTSHLMLMGLKRAEIIGWEQVFPFRIASIVPVDDLSIDEIDEQALANHLVSLCQKTIETNTDILVSNPMKKILDVISDPIVVADMVGHNFLTDPSIRQELLEIIPIKDRLEFLIEQIETGVSDL